LYPFGFGLSYSSFEFGDATVSSDSITTEGAAELSVSVRNSGARSGVAVVQLYLSDPVAQVTRPVQQLIGFTRVPLEPGQTAHVRFEVHADRTAFTGRDLRRIVEPGEIVLRVGPSSRDAEAVRLQMTGDTRVVPLPRLTTPVSVSH
jgi:hypothetical protein